MIYQFYNFSVSSCQGKRKRNFSTLSWIVCTFLLMVMFGNDVLSTILAPEIIKIDSISQLNHIGSSITTIIDKKTYVVSHNLVF